MISLWRTQAERERKVRQRYEGVLWLYYIFEELLEAGNVVSVTDQRLTRFFAGIELMSRQSAGPVRGGKPKTALSVSELEATRSSHSPSTLLPSAEFLAHDTPSRMDPGRDYTVNLTIATPAMGVARGRGPGRDQARQSLEI